jgi:hypothetical protein
MPNQPAADWCWVFLEQLLVIQLPECCNYFAVIMESKRSLPFSLMPCKVWHWSYVWCEEMQDWRVSSSGIWRRVVHWVSTDVSDENIACHLLACWFFLLNLFLRPWRWRRYVPPKRRLKPNGLHGGISQKMIIFITTAVKTSNPKCKIISSGHKL